MQHETIQHYYGEELTGSADLKTDACCTPDDLSPELKTLLGNVHDEVLARYYGCGLVAPASLEGLRVLDLGCGSGRDVYVLAQMVGESGEVVGVDMTATQLDVARTHEDWHRARFGYAASNVRFIDGRIEHLETLGLKRESFDLVVSNCVVNLSLDKKAVLDGVRRLLKPGGEMYFSDVYADRRLGDDLRKDPVLYGECLGGALYWNDFLALAGEAGFFDPRLVTARPLAIGDAAIRAKLGPAQFYSATYRLFNIPDLEADCEDYGQAVIYKGGVAGMEEVFELDAHHRMEKGQVFPVCGNTWTILKESRFAAAFDYVGSFDRHFGIFPGCGKVSPFAALVADGGAPSGCC